MAYIGVSPTNGVRNRFLFAATASQTTFTGADQDGKTFLYTDSAYLDVYQNGILLKPATDYTATTGTSIVLVTAASLDDVVELIAFDVFSVADTVSASTGGTFNGAISATSFTGSGASLTSLPAANLTGTVATARMPAGSVLQVVSAQLTPDFNTSSSSFVDVTGFNASITPQSTSSKVLVICSTSGLHTSLGQGEYRVLRDGVDPASIAGGRMWTSDGYYGSGTVNDAHMTFLDSPSSTSALTYKLQIRNRHGASMTIGKDWNADLAGLHTITLMEIAA